MHDLQAAPHGLGMDGGDVGDLDGDLRHDWRRRIVTQDADLGGRVARRHKRDDPAHVHGDPEAKQAGVEVAAPSSLSEAMLGTTLLMLMTFPFLTRTTALRSYDMAAARHHDR
jgi:hypothetical protein